MFSAVLQMMMNTPPLGLTHKLKTLNPPRNLLGHWQQ
jgi:hypothetical protein